MIAQQIIGKNVTKTYFELGAQQLRALCDAMGFAQKLVGQLYDRCLKAIANRPLEEGVGLQSYIFVKRDRGEPRVTVYFSPEGYQVCPPNNASTV